MNESDNELAVEDSDSIYQFNQKGEDKSIYENEKSKEEVEHKFSYAE